jgi:RNA polymerase sigma-70 factor (ECF subfamily)
MTVFGFELAILGVSHERAEPRALDLPGRLRAGQSEAVAEAYDLYADSIRAFARRLVGDSQSAEDLVHDVFVTLPSAIHNFRGDSSLRTFLVSVAINHARHHLRAATRRRAALQRFGEQPQNLAEDPEHAVRQRQLAELLTSLLDELPLEQRVAFVLCEVEERSSPEAAAIVGVPEATMRTRLFHARRKLRELLEQRGITP